MTQKASILQAMRQAPARAWSSADLANALPDIAPGTLRKQVARLVERGDVTRLDTGLFRLASVTPPVTPVTPTQTARDTRDTSRHVTPIDTQNAHIRAPVTRDTLPHEGAHSDAYPLAPAPPLAHDASASAHAHADTHASGHTHALADARPLTDIQAYARVLNALPVAPLKSTFRLATAFAFTRSQLSGCESPAIATAGRPGTGKTSLFSALSILLHGDTRDVIDGETLTTKPGVIGRREKQDGKYVPIPSVLLEPPERPRPIVVTIDEAANVSKPALQGLRNMLKLENEYQLEGTPMPLSALICLTWNKDKDVPDRTYWTPWLGMWQGATRRILLCDLDHASSVLKGEGKAKASARVIFQALDNAPIIDFTRYKSKVRYPDLALLEGADKVLRDVFIDPSELPLGDKVLRGACAAYGALFDYPTEQALLAAIADIATVVGTLPGLLQTDAETKLNKHLRAAGFPPITLPKVDEADNEVEVDNDPMSLSPAARARIASHLARASTKGLDELLTTLCEYNLARRERRYIRVPRWLIEVTLRWSAVLIFGVFAAVWNVGLSRLLKLPRISGGVIYSVFGFAAKGPRTQLIEYVDRDGKLLKAPRDYVLRLFGDDLAARETVEMEDAAKETEELKNAA